MWKWRRESDVDAIPRNCQARPAVQTLCFDLFSNNPIMYFNSLYLLCFKFSETNFKDHTSSLGQVALDRTFPILNLSVFSVYVHQCKLLWVLGFGNLKPQMYNINWRGSWHVWCRHKSRTVYTRWSMVQSARSLFSYSYDFVSKGKERIHISYANLQLVWYLIL